MLTDSSTSFMSRQLLNYSKNSSNAHHFLKKIIILREEYYH